VAELFNILTYTFQKNVNILDIPDTFTPIVQVTQQAGDNGIYELGFSISGTFPNITNPVVARYRINNDPWLSISKEQKDVTDNITFYYAFPYAWDGATPITIEVEGRKSGSADQLDVQYADAWIERKV
jgi:hypothetical protein